jgi:hypothetical protein
MNRSQRDIDISGLDDNLALKAQEARERALVAALVSTLRIVEIVDLGAAIRIVDRLSAAVLPLPGEPIVLDCGEMILFSPLVEEGDIAIETVKRFNQERRQGGAAHDRKPLVVDFTDPANTGGKWLRKPRKPKK